MKDIVEIAKLVNKQKIKNIPLLGDIKLKNTKLDIFYNEILNGNIKTDEDAIQILYPERKSRNALAQLKKKLHQRLINSLFFIDTNKFADSEYRRSMHRCQRNWSAAKILLDRARMNAALRLLEDTYPICKKIEYVELSYLICFELYRHYAVYTLDFKKAHYYTSQAKVHLDILNDKMFAQPLFNLISSLFNSTDSLKTNVALAKIKPDIDIIRSKLGIVKNQSFSYTAYTILYGYYLLQKDYKNVDQITKDAIQFFTKKSIFPVFGSYVFQLRFFYLKYSLGQYELAKEAIYNCLVLSKEISVINWFILHSNIVNIHLVLREYSEALRVTSLALKKKGFKKLLLRYKEPWLVREALIHFLIKIKTFSEEEVTNTDLKPFSLSKFLNDMPLFSKDKSGYNISILIIQMLFLIADKKYSQVIDRIDALRQYTHRYLRNDESFRSNCFIKMLIKIPEADFHPLRVERYTQDLYKRLKDTPIEMSENITKVEIIPYEHLWEIIMDMLQKIKDREI